VYLDDRIIAVAGKEVTEQTSKKVIDDLVSLKINSNTHGNQP